MKKIMIVAHPDDELLWGWEELIDCPNEWIVICLTNSDKRKRSIAFFKVMQLLQCQGFMYDYPDNASKLIWDAEIQREIIDDIQPFITNKVVKVITHNPQGEYGHYHHRMTSQIVTNLLTSLDKLDILHYFGFDESNISILPDIFNQYLSVYFTHKELVNDESLKSHVSLAQRTCVYKATEEDKSAFQYTSYYTDSFKRSGINTYPTTAAP
jgi:LmbE family N-acetylglucosaminyl deacetylase